MVKKVSAKAVGKRIRGLRGSVSQRDFADLIGVAQYTISRYERGESLPVVDALLAMADTFDVSVDWLLTGKDPEEGA